MLLRAATITGIFLVLGCSLISPDDPPPEEPLFAPGEYGGEPLSGTEALYNLRPSPDGERIALIRERTPGDPSDPRRQLWIVDRDGSDPELIAVNVNSVDWSPDGERLAVTVFYGGGVSFYVYTIDLETMKATQWTGREDQFFDRPVVGNPNWFQDGTRLLVSVIAKGYKQDFERGIYTINTETGEIEGPYVEVMEAAFLGNYNRYAVGQKYTYEDNPLSGNYARYTFSTGEWEWITSFSYDSLDYVQAPVPSPTSEDII